MSVRIFLSTVSDEFRNYRDQLRTDLTRHNVEVKVQEDFKDYGGATLDKLDLYISTCDAVVHLVGNMTGADAKPASPRRSLRNTRILLKSFRRCASRWIKVSAFPTRNGKLGSRSITARRC
jgi:hypothetical protein